MHKKLEIKNPCSQNWDEMTPKGKGKHCNSCNKVILDFTEMNDVDLVKMLQSGKYSCGLFTKQQMGTRYLEKEKNLSRKRYWSAIAASIVAGTLQLTSSYGQTQIPVRQNAPVVNRSTAEKLFENKNEPKNSNIEKFSFRVVDSENKQPLAHVGIEMMGMFGITDSLGRVDFQIEYEEGESITFISNLYLYKYEEEKIRLNLKNCFQKLTVLYMKRKKEKNNNRENFVLGYF